jgi:C1A family cysteine protease
MLKTIRIFLLHNILLLVVLTGRTQQTEKISMLPDFDSLIMIQTPLPEYFTLRNTGRLGAVKTQPHGGCWASAAIGSVESVWRTFGFGEAVLSDVNLKLFHGFIPERSSNGNHYMATAYFSRRSGPVMKSPENDSTYLLSPVTVQYITGARYLPKDPDLVKRTIMEFGAVYSMTYHHRNHLDTLTNIYYTKTKKINHAVLLVGWNDTLRTKTGKGAWIAQNSLGVKYGDNGFFYIPYSDPNVLEYNAIWPYRIPYEKNSRIYYYDTLGSFHSYGFRDTVCYGLVKFVAEKDLVVTKIATHINTAGSRIYAEIYDQFDPATGVLSELLTDTKPVFCRFTGYYTLDADHPVRIRKGDDFFVKMGYMHPTDTMPLPVESYIKGYADPNISAKKCWVNPDFLRWPKTWYECGSESPFPSQLFDLCIRVYCIEEEE